MAFPALAAVLPSVLSGISGLFGGGKREENESNAEYNQFLQRLLGSQASDPSKQARGAARGDIWKAFSADPDMRSAIGDAAFNAIGSSNPNILGVNKTAADFAQNYQDQRKKTNQGSMMGNILGMAAPFAGAAMAGIGSGGGKPSLGGGFEFDPLRPTSLGE